MAYKMDPIVERSQNVFRKKNLIRPTADLMFRKLLLENPGAAMDLLNRILQDKALPVISADGTFVRNDRFQNAAAVPQEIVKIKYLNADIPPDADGEKAVRLDILAECSNAAIVDIEMQCGAPGAVEKRAAYYLSRLVSGTVLEGGDYKPIPPCAVIFVLESPYFPDWEAGHTRFEFRMTHPKDLRAPKLGEGLPWLEFVELSKLKASLPVEDAVLKDWIDFLLPESEEEWLRVTRDVSMFRKLKTKIETYSADDKLAMRQRSIDEGRLGRAIDLGEAWAGGKAEGIVEGLAEGRAEGEAKGRAEGEAKGRAEGEAKGRAEGEAKALATAARAMLQKGLPRETVAEILNITLPDLELLLSKATAQ